MNPFFTIKKNLDSLRRNSSGIRRRVSCFTAKKAFPVLQYAPRKSSSALRLRSTFSIILSLFMILTLLCSCGNRSTSQGNSSVKSTAQTSGTLSENSLPEDRNISSFLTFQEAVPLEYAECFSIFQYDGGFSLINVCDGTRFLVVPEGQTAPDDLDEDITVLHRPVDRIYLAGSACMDMFVKMNALDCISMSAVKADSWYIREAREAMENGSILYAGKYSQPDYEQLLSRGCSLAVENTMILHSPEVREQLIRTGIPVIIDHSSYETHPLGRTEWVRLYGVLTGHQQDAESAFEAQKNLFQSAAAGEKTNKSISFFAISSSGSVTVRKTTDYVPAMIQLAGGIYLPDDLTDDSLLSTTSLQMEEYCKRARNADCLIYNSTIEGSITSISELLEKAPAMKNFKAVKNGNVWCTTQNLYQDSMETGIIISDFRQILTNPEESSENLHYFYKLNE